MYVFGIVTPNIAVDFRGHDFVWDCALAFVNAVVAVLSALSGVLSRKRMVERRKIKKLNFFIISTPDDFFDVIYSTPF